MKNNPWGKMNKLVQRRIDSKTPHNLYWITDSRGSYGLLIHTDEHIDFKINAVKLKGIQFVKDHNQDGETELLLILQEKNEWEIFLTLCEDLVETILKHSEGKGMIAAVERRLKRWQQLLQQDKKTPFGIEKQMGLFAELCCLKDIVAPKYGITQALKSWNGPESDKQDFLLDDAVLEVKSYRTSKGDAVSISSLKQLYSEKDTIYLATYALTASENGQSIEALVDEIRVLLNEKGSSNEFDSFELKLMSYGYVPELIKEELNSFIVDKQRLFHVTEGFPKITPKDVEDSILTVTYSIDLTKCQKFEISLDTFLK